MSLVIQHTLHLATGMAVTLSGLPSISPFNYIGELATLAQRWDKWKAKFELYVAASGVEDKVQTRTLLLHLAGPGVRKIFKTYPKDVKGDAKEFDKALTCLLNHVKVNKNVPLARQKLLVRKPNPGETINNFVTRPKSLAEHCDYSPQSKYSFQASATPISLAAEPLFHKDLPSPGDVSVSQPKPLAFPCENSNTTTLPTTSVT